MAESPSTSYSSNPVGFLLDYLRGFHQEIVWREVVDKLLAQGVPVVTFVGQAFLRGPHQETDIAATNQIFELAKNPWLSSFFLSGENMGYSLNREELADYLRPFRDRPCISLGPCSVDLPMVAVEGRSGIKEALRHLITKHGRKKIAFISGMEASIDAQERLAAYKEGLAEAGIPFSQDYVVWGDYWLTGGEKGIRTFLDERRITIDGVMAANDYMALGAMRELIKRGFRVPGDISVTGFDDVLDAEHENPALTTVRWPLHEQAEAAVSLVVKTLQGQGSQKKIALPAIVVPRRSCGCEALCMELAGSINSSPPQGSLSSAMVMDDLSVQEGELPETVLNSRPHLDKAIQAALKGDFSGFAEALEPAIHAGMRGGDTQDTWHNVLSVLRARILPGLAAAEAVMALEGSLAKLRILIGSLAVNHLRLEGTYAGNFNNKLSTALKEISGAANLEILALRLRDRLQDLGLESFYFALRPDARVDGGPDLPPDASLVFHTAFNGKTDLLARTGSLTCLARDFLPQELKPRRAFHFIAMPVTFGNNFHGIAVYESGSVDSASCVRIQDQICTTVHGLLLLEAARQSDSSRMAKTERIINLARPISEAVLGLAKLASDQISTVQTTSEAARKMHQDILQTQTEITNMAGQARSIGSYLAMIEDVSATISLLGLNAAIEAAHVGQAGRGFNVIASEIRKLAESTQKSAETISRSLGDLTRETEGSVKSASQSAKAFSVLNTELDRVLGALQNISGLLGGLAESSAALMTAIQDDKG